MTRRSCFYLLFGIVALLGWAPAASAQGAFQNLNFEKADLPVLAEGQSGGFLSVPVSSALPGWHTFIGNQEIANVSHNVDSLGAANVTVYGPAYVGTIIQGLFSVSLQAGANAPNPLQRDVTISQVGIVPSNAGLLEISIGIDAQNYSVELAGTSLSLTPVASTAQYTLYQADVSQFAGTLQELRLTSIWTSDRRLNPVEFDNIQFIAVPEPSIMILLFVGVGALWAARRKIR